MAAGRWLDMSSALTLVEEEEGFEWKERMGEEVRMGTYSHVGLEEESAAFVLFIALFFIFTSQQARVDLLC